MRFYYLTTILILIVNEGPVKVDCISHKTVKSWAQKLGYELSQLGKYITNVQEFREKYSRTEIKPRDGNALVQEISKDIKSVMDSKLSAVKRIVDAAETSAMRTPVADPPKNFTFVNTNDIAKAEGYKGQVYYNMSAIHVPVNVYNRTQAVAHAIKWSEDLEKVFMKNYKLYPSLSYQYFGSVTGFMRQYPAIGWDLEEVDLFDCRTRTWYIEAATSPKDILVLVDNSGSMTGMRKKIARQVVNNILDTLGDNDFVNIITFSNVTREVVPCFKDTLVQANLANVREFKTAMEDLETDGFANFSKAFNWAFKMLETYRTDREGARCNQAVMLVTDGVPYNYREIFQKYNWRDNPENPEKADMPVRVFTYLIGREVTDVRDAKWMACANKGYYVHLSTVAEVREQVLNYVSVMARPLVLGQTTHPTMWTPVYADVTDPMMTDWLWKKQQCAEQKKRFQKYRLNRAVFNSTEEQDPRFGQKQRGVHEQHGYPQKLMTSVSMPIFDRGINATRFAHLLGVAGTDIPIEKIQKLTMPHMLGVNGYAFVVTNNGYILIHPDLRPFGILKPTYNNVDMAEVELVDQGKGPREFGPALLAFRDNVINQSEGSLMLHTKYHYDDMKRVARVKRMYYCTGIENTPFTVVVSLPEYEHSGSYRIHTTEETHRYHVSGRNVTDYIVGDNWRVHPEWMYCRYHNDSGDNMFNTTEKRLLHFLEHWSDWKWINMEQVSYSPKYSPVDTSSGSSFGKAHRKTHPTSNKADGDPYYCDKNLILNLVFDAIVTERFADTRTIREEKLEELQQRFGLKLAFIATHSGLTRWQDFPRDEGLPAKDHFSKLHPRATDEVWYKRAVEQHYVQPGSFVFSVPIDEAGADNTTLVTASHAIFIGNGKVKAPAAVVGFQFQHSTLQELFRNVTSTCEGLRDCKSTCDDESLACYLIDNNGYIMAAKNDTDTGKFFGEVRGPVMSSLVDEGIFDMIRIYDYQAVCFRDQPMPSHSNILLTPWKSLERAITWLMTQLAWAWVNAGFLDSDYAYAHSPPAGKEDEKKFDQRVLINRTRPQPCDQEVNLYLLQKVSSIHYDVDSDSENGCIRPYVVQPVDFSNMLLLVVDTMCPYTDEPKLKVVPEEVVYNDSLVCYKVANGLLRRKPQTCIRSHPTESKIKDLCGSTSKLGLTMATLFLPICLMMRLNEYS